MLRIAVCDDDAAFLHDFVPMLTALFADAGHPVTVSPFQNGEALLRAVEVEKQIFDVVFLDVNMPGVHGFQVARRLREISAVFILVFTTWVENQSREGYRYGAFRYVFKNNLQAELAEAVRGILAKLGYMAQGGEEITFKCRALGVLEQVTVQKHDILYLKAEKTRRVTLKTTFGEYGLLVKPLAKYAQQLPPPDFVPVVRSYLVGLAHVENIEGDSFVLTGGHRVPLGVKREARKASMEKYLHFLEGRL